MIIQTDMEYASLLEIFEKLFSDEIYDLTVEKTIRFAKSFCCEYFHPGNFRGDFYDFAEKFGGLHRKN